MSIAALIRRMADAGATPEAIAIAVEAIEAEQGRASDKRAAAAARKARQRERDSHGTVTGQGGDSHDAKSPPFAPLPLSPTPPNPNPPISPQKQDTPAASAPGPSASSKAKSQNAKPTYHGDFEMLWSEFPRHPNSSKAEAYKAWLRLPEEDRDPAFDAARMFAAKVATEGQDIRFVPHLVTWINQRRFDTILEAAE